jgi:hypothetical protein
MVAARNADVGFIVMLAGSGVPGDQILVEQRTLIAQAGGVSKEQAEKDAAEERTVLAPAGGKDLQAPPAQNLPAIRAALEAAGNENFEAVELPGLNHLFQTATTGSPLEYAAIEETMSPLALGKISEWIGKLR